VSVGSDSTPMKHARTAECVSDGHPDKFCDQVADAILDEAYALATQHLGDEAAQVRESIRLALDGVAKGHHITLVGEWRLPLAVEQRLDPLSIARRVWREIGYPESEASHLTCTMHIHPQSPEIAKGVDGAPGRLGAGDQGISVGYATDETAEFLPKELVIARRLLARARTLRQTGLAAWLRPDGKSQVTLDTEGNVQRIVVALQHSESISLGEVRQFVADTLVPDVLGSPLAPNQLTVNGAGAWTLGGPIADAGTIGRKVVVDAYGPQVPVGGGAFSGKDPTKIDRSMAYMARLIAKAAVARRIYGARECTVKIAFAIGQEQPEMVSAVTQDGTDLSAWVSESFDDLRPSTVIHRLQLTNPSGWSYRSAAAFGHFGRDEFPWEQVTQALAG
jgi:S-adenosylmethionine synthetase